MFLAWMPRGIHRAVFAVGLTAETGAPLLKRVANGGYAVNVESALLRKPDVLAMLKVSHLYAMAHGESRNVPRSGQARASTHSMASR